MSEAELLLLEASFSTYMTFLKQKANGFILFYCPLSSTSLFCLAGDATPFLGREGCRTKSAKARQSRLIATETGSCFKPFF